MVKRNRQMKVSDGGPAPLPQHKSVGGNPGGETGDAC